jgi:hypothetical protein
MATRTLSSMSVDALLKPDDLTSDETGGLLSLAGALVHRSVADRLRAAPSVMVTT